MGEIDYFMEQIPCLLSCTCFAGAVAVYYKRNFRSDKLPLVFFLILSSISSNRSVESSSRLSFIITFSLCFSVVYNIVKHLKWLNTVRLDFFLAILLTAYDYKFDILTTTGRLIGIPYSVGAQKCTCIMNFVRIMFVVIPQFIRRPSQLKAKLQGLRSKLGPIYIIYCTKFVMEYTYYGTLTLYTMGIFAVVSAVVGGVFLRPDNTAVLEILGFGTKMNQRKYFHGRGMIISFSCIALMMGNGQAILTEKEIQEIRDETPFTDAEVKSLLNRYDEVDTSENNSTGLSYDDVLYMPEFIGSVFAPLVIAANVDTKTKRIYARQFIKICSILSTQIKAEEKKKYLFELLNIYGTGLLTHDEIYRMYKLLFSHTISDDHILAMTFKALNHPALHKKGQLTKQEFFKMIPDHEIMNRMTINFRL